MPKPNGPIHNINHIFIIVTVTMKVWYACHSRGAISGAAPIRGWGEVTYVVAEVGGSVGWPISKKK